MTATKADHDDAEAAEEPSAPGGSGADVADQQHSEERIQEEEHDAAYSINAEPEQLPSSDTLRRLANTHFANGDYDTALPLYSLAIDGARAELAASAAVADFAEEDGGGSGRAQDPSEESPLVVHLCNRSACLFRMERYDEAEIDARDALELSHGTCVCAYPYEYFVFRGQYFLILLGANWYRISCLLDLQPSYFNATM